jgi:hypothetical protein
MMNTILKGVEALLECLLIFILLKVSDTLYSQYCYFANRY